MGVRVTKVHRVLLFEQRPWLKDYIEGNSKRRAETTLKREQDMYKLNNNAVYGKTVENVRGRTDFRLCFNGRHYKRLVRDIRYKPNDVLLNGAHADDQSKHIVGVSMSQTDMKFATPVPAGVAVLDLSKLLMLQFHYDVMLPRYGRDNVRLIYTDTDSFVYHIKTEDVYADMWAMKEHYDMAGYSEDHPIVWLYHDKTNNKVIGLMKDESSGNPIWRFVAIRPKVYAYEYERHKKVGGSWEVGKGSASKAKGVVKSVQKTLGFDRYVSVLQTGVPVAVDMKRIETKKHQLSTVAIKKRKAFDACDTKRYWIPRDDGGLGLMSLPFGHYRCSA
eukprot:jgi/Chrzof1/1452/Cz10g08140.t1